MIGRNESAMGPFRISLPRTYDASPERVFRAWTDANSARSWLAMGGDASIDPRPDGLFYLGMSWNGQIRPHYGRYLRVESPRLLEFTWVSESTRQGIGGHDRIHAARQADRTAPDPRGPA